MEEKSRMIGNDSESNGFLVGLIMKVAIALESKNVKDMREMALELEGWELKEEEMDVKTKLFVEHILLAFSRVEIGLGVLDIAAEELTKVRDKMRVEDDKKAAEEFLDSVSECDCNICKSSKCGKCRRVIDHVNSKVFSDYGICIKCYSEEPDIDEIYKDESIVPKSKYAGAPYDQDKDEKDVRKACFSKTFTCDRCRIDYDIKKRKFIDNYSVCVRCVRAFYDWFDAVKDAHQKQDWKNFKGKMKKLTKDYDHLRRDWNDSFRSTKENWDRREKRLDGFRKTSNEVRKKIDEMKKRAVEEERRAKSGFKKDELSDDEKDDLK